MRRAASVSGRIVSASGPEGVQGMEVVLARPGYDAEGRKTFALVANTVTDDRGEYRLFGVPAGRYYLIARAPMAPVMAPNGTRSISNVTQIRKYTTTYFPGTSDMARAELISLAPGAEEKGIDLVVKEEQTYRVRGRVVDGATGQAPVLKGLQGISIEVFPRPVVAVTGSSFPTSPNRDDGAFEIANVPSGAFILFALQMTPTLPPDVLTRFGGQTGPPPPSSIAWADVDVTSAPLLTTAATSRSEASLRAITN